MSKIIFKSDAIRVQWSNTLPNNFNETSYFNTTVSNDGTNIILTNPNDPNFVDVEVLYADIVNPVSGSITELEDLIRCEILTHTNRMIHFPESNDIVPAPCLGLQNVNDDLYWNGAILSGGGGNVVTADNGLNFTGGNPNNITLGGALTNNTDIDTLDFRFKVEGTDPGFGYNQGLSINANINQAQLFSTTQNSLIGWDSGLNRLMIQSGSLEGVTITNDGTNNILLDPAYLNLNHNTLIQIQFNDGAGKTSNIVMDNVEAAFNYINTSTGAISQHSLNDSYWLASYQSANLSSVQLDDNWVRTTWQNGATADVSYIIAQNGNVTLENTDGSSVANTTLSATGITTTLTDNTTSDYVRIRTLASGIDLDANINGGNNSTLSINPDIIFASGGMGYGFTLLSGLMPTVLPPKHTFYFIDTNTTPGTFTFDIPAENCYPGYVMTVKDSYGNASNRTININTALGQMELGLTQTINTNFGYRTFVYSGSTWLTVAQG